MTTSASWINRRAFSVKSSGSPGPAPTNATEPCSGSNRIWRSSSASNSCRITSSEFSATKRSGLNTSRQNFRRANPSGSARTRALNAFASRAKRPRSAGSIASMSALICRANTGAEPSVPIATTTGSLSTIAGVMKSQASVRSSTFTSAPFSLAETAI